MRRFTIHFGNTHRGEYIPRELVPAKTDPRLWCMPHEQSNSKNKSAFGPTNSGFPPERTRHPQTQKRRNPETDVPVGVCPSQEEDSQLGRGGQATSSEARGGVPTTVAGYQKLFCCCRQNLEFLDAAGLFLRSCPRLEPALTSLELGRRRLKMHHCRGGGPQSPGMEVWSGKCRQRDTFRVSLG